jgi:ketoreductase RED2
VQADIAEERGLHATHREVLEHYGQLDVLVNNAGTTKVIPHADLEAASRRRVARDLRGQRLWHVESLVAAMAALRASHGPS